MARQDVRIDLAIRNGTVVTAERSYQADVGIRGGVIVAIGQVAEATEAIDATGLRVMPGGVDPHTHLDLQGPDGRRSPTNFGNGTVAAASGGVTTIVDYARQPAGMSLAETVEHWNTFARAQAVIDYAFHIWPQEVISDFLQELPAMVSAGFPTYKLFMHRVSDEGILSTMRALRAAGGLAMLHCENAAIDHDAYQALRATGKLSARNWADSSPTASECEAVSRAIDYGTYTECPIYIVHVSCAEAVARLRHAKQTGARVWAETRPCYALFTRSVYEQPGDAYLGLTGYPPMRDAVDVEAIWQGMRDGTIDTIGSDHAAWTLEQKRVGEDDYTKLPIGLPGIETQGRAIYSEGVAREMLSENRFVALMATNPALAMGLYPKKGTIAVGSDADIVLWNPNLQKTIHNSDMHAGVGYEPCDGMVCTGWPVRTIARGDTVMLDGEVIANPGRGRLLQRFVD